jgi:hypothetical protein
MKAIIKNIDLGSNVGFEEYSPDEATCFGVWIFLTAGPDDAEGGHLFDILVCTPDWLKKVYLSQQGGAVWGRHMLIVFRYDPEQIKNEISKYLEQCEGKDFWEMAQKIARIGFWEFEDYKP